MARLYHPEVVRDRLRAATLEALADLSSARPLDVKEPVTIRMKFRTTTRADILQAVPGMRLLDGTTVEVQARTMAEAYALIRLMYKYVSW